MKDRESVINALYAVLEQHGVVITEPAGGSIVITHKSGQVGTITLTGIQRWAERVSKGSSDQQRNAIDEFVKALLDDGPAGSSTKR